MATKPSRPKYNLCWWCNLRFRGNHYRVMQSADHAANSNVAVHVACGDEMIDEGWNDALAKNENAA